MTRHYFVHDFFETAKEGKDHFVEQYAHPFLVWLGQRAAFDDASEDEGAFFTSVISKSALHDRIAIDLSKLLNPSYEVFPLVKRSSLLPGAKPQSAVIMVGRAVNSDVVLPFTNVSKSHFYITMDPFNPDHFVIVDSNSTNGTKVNDKTIRAQTRISIKSGDNITLGTDVRLKFFTSLGFWESLQRLASRHT
jgi:hypothetical protein